MSKNVYEQIKLIAEKAEKEEASGGVSFFRHYKSDLYQVDKDILEFDSQRGDNYIWALKDNGCGTALTRTGVEHATFLVGNEGDEARFYLLSMTGPNKGTVLRVSKDRALEHAEELTFPGERKPRRHRVLDLLEKEINIRGNFSINKTVIAADFNPRPGDKTCVKILRATPTRVSVQIVRHKMAENDRHEDRTQKDNETYAIDAPGSYMYQAGEFVKESYHLIESTQQGYARIKDIDKKTFNRALKSVEKAREKNKTAEPDCSFG